MLILPKRCKSVVYCFDSGFCALYITWRDCILVYLEFHNIEFPEVGRIRFISVLCETLNLLDLVNYSNLVTILRLPAVNM